MIEVFDKELSVQLPDTMVAKRGFGVAPTENTTQRFVYENVNFSIVPVRRVSASFKMHLIRH